LTDNGQETWNLLAQRGIEHVILCGVPPEYVRARAPFRHPADGLSRQRRGIAARPDRHDVQSRTSAGRQSFRRQRSRD
jgi:hypothetical protein